MSSCCCSGPEKAKPVIEEGTVLGETESVCPVCLRRIPARRVAEADGVYLVKSCPGHGTFRVPVWRGDPASYESWGAAEKTPARPPVCSTEMDMGCPFDCGLCPDHRQHSCCVLVEVTERCNLSCPVCFASSGAAPSDPGLEEVAGWLRALKAINPNVNIQLSGGEPTVRDDLPDIVAMALEMGFPFVQVNTNGVRLAKDEAYLKRLKQAGLGCVFLQFDGVTDEVYRVIRGADLIETKSRAIANCARANLGVVLVPTLVPGVNTGQIGDIIRYAIERMPYVRTVHFQPISYFGRFPEQPKDADRITIPEVLQEIERQTDGAMKATDFHPGTAENPYCTFNGRFLVRPNQPVRSLGMPASGGCCSAAPAAETACCSSSDGEDARRARRFVARHWSAPDVPGEEGSGSCCSPGINVASFDALLEEERYTFLVSGMAFQDAWTLDLDRLRQCYVHILDHDRRLVPLCSFNLSAMDGATLYRGRCR